MKRFTVLLTLTAIFSVSSIAIASTINETGSNEITEFSDAEATYKVSVVKITGNGYLITKWLKEKGVFDSYEMTLTIEGNTYKVKNNYYQDKTRGKYMYVANNVYFFNCEY